MYACECVRVCVYVSVWACVRVWNIYVDWSRSVIEDILLTVVKADNNNSRIAVISYTSHIISSVAYTEGGGKTLLLCSTKYNIGAVFIYYHSQNSFYSLHTEPINLVCLHFVLVKLEIYAPFWLDNRKSWRLIGANQRPFFHVLNKWQIFLTYVYIHKSNSIR